MKKIILIILIILAACTTSNNSGTIKIHFCGLEDCSRIYLQTIMPANEINCALYNLNNPEIIQLLKLKNAKIFTEHETYKKINHVLPVKYNYKKSLMHNKFCIFDKKIVITGSYNPTQKKYYDNILLINSPVIANNYLKEFQELYYDQSVKRTPQPLIYFNSTIIENYFCPEDNCKQHIINVLEKANNSIYFMVSSFTDKEIAQILNEKSKKIIVKGLMDDLQAQNKWSVYDAIKNFTKLISSLHNKVLIIDNNVVITGSYNPTKNADEKNDENILIIHDPEIAKTYLREYNRIYSLNN